MMFCLLVLQSNLNNKGFGQDLPTVENDVEEHNIFHSEVEALAPYVTEGDDKVRQLSEIQASLLFYVSYV